ncbi:MAG: TetR/AcrR family transcriptional regulator [Candidatus Thiodiazotropha sp. (ex Monitilora ramsayi)]|nr:TetR/AcrR family transcriptional regulator [Candidatus Thiodiazotropha sp. (ex Monitilora ramsayi)]
MNRRDDNGVRQRLIDAAMQCFLDDDYHRVSTRQIAAAADANASMIRYYFGNKEGLYEEMIRSILQPLLDVLESSLLSSTEGFADYFRIYYRTMQENPRFPVLVLKVLALNQGPGKRFIQQLLERGRQRGREKIELLKQHGLVEPEFDPDAVRIAFVSLAMLPMLIKPVFEEQMEREMDEAFLEQLAVLNGRLFSAGLLPTKEE